ncbi:UDP-glucuronosyltransferase 3A1-like isoform X1 [Prionailurus iriomotensis]
MTGQRALLLAGFLLSGFLIPEAAKILTVSSLDMSQKIKEEMEFESCQQSNFKNGATLFSTHELWGKCRNEKKENAYQVISWLLPEHHEKELKEHFDSYIEEALHGREAFDTFVKLMEQLGIQCSDLLRRSDIMDSLKNENFDLVFVEAFDFCSFLIAEKLVKPFVSILPSPFGSVDLGLPNPVSYVPVFHSLLTDRMDFWGRVRNFLMFLDFFLRQWRIQSTFDNTIKEHFPEDSRPVLSHLLKKAELWFVNSDFALEFARPLLPNTVYIGGLMVIPVKPVPQEFENFISKFGDSGFVLVAMGSMVGTYQSQEVLMEMNSAFARLSQGVIWNCKPSKWPKDVKLAANVKIVDWLPQNDLLAHPRIRLFVTHGGLNSIMEAIQHGVPIVGIPVLGDHPENMVRVEAKKFGVSIQLNQIKAETLALKMKEVIEDKSVQVSSGGRQHHQALPPPDPCPEAGGLDRPHPPDRGCSPPQAPCPAAAAWHEQYLLDVFLFLLVVTLSTLWLCGKLLGMVPRWLCGARKLKKA